MIKIYTAPSCLSCRKVKKYFKENNIPYVEKNIMQTPLLREDIYKMLIHSDRGFQYTNRAFHHMLTKVGMTQSMSRIAKCIDNGPMEGFWGILKRERYYGQRSTDRGALVKMIEDYIEYYNNKRLQRKLGVLTPMEKHKEYLVAA